MYRKVSFSFHNGKVEYCTTSGSGDIQENASALFLLRLYFPNFSSISLVLYRKFAMTNKQTDRHPIALSYKYIVITCHV